MSGKEPSCGATIMSQVLVPMIFTRVPGLMPRPDRAHVGVESPHGHGHAFRQAGLFWLSPPSTYLPIWSAVRASRRNGRAARPGPDRVEQGNFAG